MTVMGPMLFLVLTCRLCTLLLLLLLLLLLPPLLLFAAVALVSAAGATQLSLAAGGGLGVWAALSHQRLAGGAAVGCDCADVFGLGYAAFAATAVSLARTIAGFYSSGGLVWGAVAALWLKVFGQ